MKLKRNSLIVLISGCLILILGLISPIVYWNNYTSQNGATGIIGGADAPTYRFMLSALFDGLPFVLILVGISLVVSSGFCLSFSKTVKAYCKINSSVISLGLSAVGALGLTCAFIWFTIVSFGKMSKYPIEYPVSVLLGILCFFVFILLIALYFKARKKNWRIKGVIIDILTSIVFLPTFFFAFTYLYEITYLN
ncbi:MAG: hypothetical protein IKC95_02145 [Oscillospiraceae bacterium]|nr:hypothetical protein [Oscillospiraceae bacterium]